MLYCQAKCSVWYFKPHVLFRNRCHILRPAQIGLQAGGRHLTLCLYDDTLACADLHVCSASCSTNVFKQTTPASRSQTPSGKESSTSPKAGTPSSSSFAKAAAKSVLKASSSCRECQQGWITCCIMLRPCCQPVARQTVTAARFLLQKLTLAYFCTYGFSFLQRQHGSVAFGLSAWTTWCGGRKHKSACIECACYQSRIALTCPR